MEEYECVLGAGDTKHPLNQEVTLRLRNPDTFEAMQATIIIRSSFEEYPEASKLYYVIATSGRDRDPVPIEIVKIEADAVEDVTALPRRKLTLGERKGKMLADMIKERQQKKK